MNERKMKGFRNLLVHRYGPIKDEITNTDIKEGLDDFQDIFNGIRYTTSKFTKNLIRRYEYIISVGMNDIYKI